MPRQKFSNQTQDQIIAHLSNLLNYDVRYNLLVDPLGIHFTIAESTKQDTGMSNKRRKIKEGQKNMTRGQRKVSGTKKVKGAKIRTVKKGRTVPLKGIFMTDK
ncbi:MAG: hypothetical protein CVT90_02270 [Candidatus Altiarchaeales archaeon HGW-Altiarchaeales-3]|nr:MAG: hypothetical protein CVT90_02270 [Candidatus Altiarchaeales archaeon HGW-Altiarchaeales-3]